MDIEYTAFEGTLLDRVFTAAAYARKESMFLDFICAVFSLSPDTKLLFSTECHSQHNKIILVSHSIREFILCISVASYRYSLDIYDPRCVLE